jgi:SAM-dependent methyltransferase
MGTVEHHQTTFDSWLATDRGRDVFHRQRKLILDLVTPLQGESVLEIGCGAGHFLKIFQDQKCVVTGIDSSEDNLRQARKRLGDSAELIKGACDDLPFSDNEFDIVTIIYELGAASNPDQLLAEAIRVSHRRVFIGFLNYFSFAGTHHSFKKLFGLPLTRPIRCFNVFDMKSRVERFIKTPSLQWGSVIFFPGRFYDWFSDMENAVPRRNNPFGAFMGMVFPVKYVLRTVQSPVLEQFDFKVKTRPVTPEPIRNMARRGNQ